MPVGDEAIYFIETFTTADVDPLPSPWVTVTSASPVKQVSNRARANSLGTNNVARYSDFLAKIMRCTATIYHADGQVDVGVRCSSTAFTFYTSNNGGELRTAKFIAGAFTDFFPGGSGVSAATGDTIGVAANGSNIYSNKNGVTVLGPTSDSAIESGTWCIRILAVTDTAIQELDNIVLETADFYSYEPKDSFSRFPRPKLRDPIPQGRLV